MRLGTTEIILIIVLALVRKSIKDFKSAVKEDEPKEAPKDEGK